MSTNQHTPGPWRYSFESIDPEWAVVTTSGGACIANVNADMRQEANARLIAAAPDLLEACKAVLYSLEQVEECFNADGDFSVERIKLANAIVKATSPAGAGRERTGR